MINVVIVDDEILARVGIQSLLENCQDIRVAGAFSLASDALEFLKTNIVDIVITDIEMPYMNGLEFIRKVREQHLAEGILILSCYDKFEYAKQAITLGTDSYILKNSINKETITREIYSVYEKISARETQNSRAKQTEQNLVQEGCRAVAIIEMPKEAKRNISEHAADKIIVNLVNDIVSHYHMGYLIESYNKRNPFVIFEFPEDSSKAERKELLEGYLETILKNIFQYTNYMPYIAVSREFESLQEIPNGYSEAETAAEMRFYKEKKFTFYAEEICWSENRPEVMFEPKDFLEPDGIFRFERELQEYLEKCRREKIRIKNLQEVLMQSISIFVYSVLRAYFDDYEIVKWNSRYPFMETVVLAESAEELLRNMTAVMDRMREDLAEKLKDDGFMDVLDYIDKNCASKISIKELADYKHMSVSQFARKFKEKMRMAPVQYINQRKIELVREYLKKEEYTLREIAEMTGFSNENYMVRVFRKITGKTITDYRKEIIRRKK